MQQNFISQLFSRLKSESPKFFKTLQIAFGSLGAILWILNFLIAKHFIPVEKAQVFVDLLNAVAGGSTGVFLASMLTTTDPKLISPEVKVNVLKDVIENKPSEIIEKVIADK